MGLLAQLCACSYLVHWHAPGLHLDFSLTFPEDRSFSLDEVAKAHEYLEKGHATGKVLIEIGTITE
jgi:hypothetical protein